MASSPRRPFLISAFCAGSLLTGFGPAGAGEGEPPGKTLEIPGLPPMALPPGARVEPSDPMGTPIVGAPDQRAGRPDDDPDDDTVLTPGERRRQAAQGYTGPGYTGQAYGGQNFGSTLIGPGGVIRPPAPPKPPEPPKKKPPTLAEKQEAIRKAMAPKPALSFVRRHTLDGLYTKLAAASDADESKGLATLIAEIWMRSGSDTANLLMQRAAQAVDKKDYPLALKLLDRIVDLKPGWAEGWNKRASVRYVTGNYDGSMEDVEHVLKLEPKHFGALEGMAAILQKTGFPKRALEIYRRALEIYPHQPDVEKVVEKLTLEVEGQGI